MDSALASVIIDLDAAQLPIVQTIMTETYAVLEEVLDGGVRRTVTTYQVPHTSPPPALSAVNRE